MKRKVSTPRLKFQFNSRRALKKARNKLNTNDHGLMTSEHSSASGNFLFVQSKRSTNVDTDIISMMSDYGGTYVGMIY